MSRRLPRFAVGRTNSARPFRQRQKTQLDAVSTFYLHCLEPCRFFNMRLSKRSATFWFAFGICCTWLAGCATSGGELRTASPIRLRPRPPSLLHHLPQQLHLFFTRQPDDSVACGDRRLPWTRWFLSSSSRTMRRCRWCSRPQRRRRAICGSASGLASRCRIWKPSSRKTALAGMPASPIIWRA